MLRAIDYWLSSAFAQDMSLWNSGTPPEQSAASSASLLDALSRLHDSLDIDMKALTRSQRISSLDKFTAELRTSLSYSILCMLEDEFVCYMNTRPSSQDARVVRSAKGMERSSKFRASSPKHNPITTQRSLSPSPEFLEHVEDGIAFLTINKRTRQTLPEERRAAVALPPLIRRSCSVVNVADCCPEHTNNSFDTYLAQRNAGELYTMAVSGSSGVSLHRIGNYRLAACATKSSDSLSGAQQGSDPSTPVSGKHLAQCVPTEVPLNEVVTRVSSRDFFDLLRTIDAMHSPSTAAYLREALLARSPCGESMFRSGLMRPSTNNVIRRSHFDPKSPAHAERSLGYSFRVSYGGETALPVVKYYRTRCGVMGDPRSILVFIAGDPFVVLCYEVEHLPWQAGVCSRIGKGVFLYQFSFEFSRSAEKESKNANSKKRGSLHGCV